MTAEQPRLSPPGPERFTLHVAGPGDLDRLGRTMANCLASYGRGRTDGADRIVEVREAGRTRYAVHVRAGRILMFEAPGNRTPDRADVPVVRDLLAAAGLLDGTRASATRAREVAPAGAPAPPRQPRRRSRPAPPPRRDLSIQQLAADLLRPPRLGAPEWPEVAAALWAIGLLPRLPDPTEAVWEQVVLDLAGRVAVGDLDGLVRRPVPEPAERSRAADDLRARVDVRTLAGLRRERMTDVLAAPLVA